MADNTLQSVLNIAQTLLTQVQAQDITTALIVEKVDIAAEMISGGREIRREAVAALLYLIEPETVESNTRKKLITGGSNSFLTALCQSIRKASEIDFAVAFITAPGLRLLLPDLHEALESNAHTESNNQAAKLRVLTSDYLDVTDPDALRLLLLLQEKGADVRIYETANHSFHMKAYLFTYHKKDCLQGTAFIGSSNITCQALKDGLEWNYRIDFPTDTGFLEARQHFNTLFYAPSTTSLTDQWIERYETRRKSLPQAIAPGSQEKQPPPEPTSIQREALAALKETRNKGFRRGLVVLATGLGKTWLSAFDTEQANARRVLFVAHREEIIDQAAETFIRIRPKAKLGFYKGKIRDMEVDILCASVQTLSRVSHLQRFDPQHFDYIIIDEFHHTAASTYRRLLNYFSPRFMLGLTATPDRTDQSDILSFCDDNLVFTCNLFSGIEQDLLAPFHYFGIYDETVDYEHIPWRNGRFDPEQLSNKLATLARARHGLREWQAKGQKRTLAFCVSIRHACFMADHFSKAGVLAAAVYAGSTLSRGDALQQLQEGSLAVLFTVDLFNEGVDLPAIDTVMMLRPTESKILFLQQLGRGLRKAEGKEYLTILDFIGNHKAFVHKISALLDVGSSYRQLAEFAIKAENKTITLPAGCYINYDLRLLDFLKSLEDEGLDKKYQALRDLLGHRPTLSEFYRSGESIAKLQKQYSSWFEFVDIMGDLSESEQVILQSHPRFLGELEKSTVTIFQIIVIETLIGLNGWQEYSSIERVSESCWEIVQRRQFLLTDIPDEIKASPGHRARGLAYWCDNAINPWLQTEFFREQEKYLVPRAPIEAEQSDIFIGLVQELINYRFAVFDNRKQHEISSLSHTTTLVPKQRIELPYFPNIKMACGHFKTGRSDAEEYRSLGEHYANLSPERHFIAQASGDSMNGGKNPIQDGDYLLLELVTPTSAGSVTGHVMAIERQDESGDSQYLLRVVTKASDGSHILKANNPAYADLPATENMRTLARFKAIIDPLELAIGQAWLREDIPTLFGEQFNPGNWNVGHVVLNHKKAHILLITMNKQGKQEAHRYLDYWLDERKLHWQSQNSTTPAHKKGLEIIEHEKRGIKIHLFVREGKLSAGKTAPFVYKGVVKYISHSGSKPMSVIFEVQD